MIVSLIDGAKVYELYYTEVSILLQMYDDR